MTPYASKTFPDGLPWLTVAQFPDVIATGANTGALARHVGLPTGTAWQQIISDAPPHGDSVTCAYDMALAALPSFEAALKACSPKSSAELHVIGKDGVDSVIEAMHVVQADVRAAFEANLAKYVDTPGIVTVAAIDGKAIGAFILRRDVRLNGDVIEYRINPLLHGGRGSFTNIALMTAFHHQVVADLECIIHGAWTAKVPATLRAVLMTGPGTKEDPLVLVLRELIADAHRYVFGLRGERMPDERPSTTITMDDPVIVENPNPPIEEMVVQ